MPAIRIVPVFDPKVRALCVRPYEGHPHGCPNFGKKKGCPPSAPLLPDVFDLAAPCFAIFNVFRFGDHIEKMRAAHPAWSLRQLRNCLYWQGTARKALKGEIDKFVREVKAPDIDRETFERYFAIEHCPEAMGLNVTATMARVGEVLEWPPVTRAAQIAFAGRKR